MDQQAPCFRYLDRTLPSLAENLALDEALLRDAEDREGPPVLRFWESPTFAVVLGASGRLREEVDLDACRADGVPVARRSSGGGTVVIGPGALNFAVVLPLDHAPGLHTVEGAQRFVLARVADELRRLGSPVEVLGSGDLTLGRRKFAGSAQRRLRRHFLVHATILRIGFPLERIGRYLALPQRQPAYREGRSHDEFVTNLDRPRSILVETIRAAWLPSGSDPLPALVPENLVKKLVAEKFGDPTWVERL
jgi:lipoate-protein ligase A